MTCEKCELIISANCDGEASDAEQAMMFAHLQSCQDCRRFIREVIQIRTDALTEGQMHPPRRLDIRVLGGWGAEPGLPGRTLWDAVRRIATTRIALPVPVILGLVIALLVGGSYFLQHPEKPAVPERVTTGGIQRGMSLPVIRISK